VAGLSFHDENRLDKKAAHYAFVAGFQVISFTLVRRALR
jgi:hypothetical protein